MFATKLLPLAVIAAAASLTACGSSAGPPTPTHAATPQAQAQAGAVQPARAGHVSVTITNYTYTPDHLTVKAGTTITFVNHDSTAHTATSDTAGVFDTGTVAPGGRRSVTLSKRGSESYHCAFHAFMTGSITVVG
jgi:plastocyanin